MEDSDESTELWQHPNLSNLFFCFLLFYRLFNQTQYLVKVIEIWCLLYLRDSLTTAKCDLMCLFRKKKFQPTD